MRIGDKVKINGISQTSLMYLYFANKDCSSDIYSAHMLKCIGNVGTVTHIMKFPLNVNVFRVKFLNDSDIYVVDSDVSVTEEELTPVEFLPKWMIARINLFNAYQDISDRY